MMKDIFGRGLIAGIAGAILINIVEVFLTLLNISESTLWEAGGIVFLSEQVLDTPLGIAIGVFSHVFVSLVVGIGISYYLYFSGTNYAVLKGIGISLIAGFITLGIVFPLRGLAPEMQHSPGDVTAAFIDHIVFGALAGYIVKYGQTKNKPEEQPDHKNHLYVPLGSKKLTKSKKHNKFKKPKKI